MDATENPQGDPGPKKREYDPRLLELALRIADEKAVDWEAERRSAPDLSESLEPLRELEALAESRRLAEREDVRAGREEPHAPGAAVRGETAPPGEAAAPAQREALFQWGPLRVLERLGGGGYGEVFLAWDPALHRQVALKLRREDRGARTERWLDEARRMARVRHPHVLTVYGAETHDGRSGIWCDLIRGRTLEDLIQENGPMSATEAALVGIDLCSALAAVHAAGLVHGDVKAKNVMRVGTPLRDRIGANVSNAETPPRDRVGGLDPAGANPADANRAGNLVLMDFGASREISPEPHSPGGSTGTPLYAAPELLQKGRPSVASDIYAVGVLLFRLVSGRFPVEARSLEELRKELERGSALPLRSLRPDLPPAFLEVVERASAAHAANRFADAAALERALRGVLGLSAGSIAAPVSPRRSIVPLLVGAAAVAAVWAAVTWLPPILQPRFRVAPTRPYVALNLRESLEGRIPGDKLGQSVAGLGDIDGDGIPDYAVGAPGADQSRGEVTIYSGVPGRPPLLTLKGEHQGDMFGWAIACLGDVNGDGYPDFAITALYGDGRETDSGTAYVYCGGPLLSDKPAVVLEGWTGLSDFGYAVSAAGDVNGDGRPDILVSAPLEAASGRSDGAVYLFLGGAKVDTVPHLVLSGGSEGSQFGIAVTGLGDFNGDGTDDFAVGANWDNTDGPYSGRAFVYYGGVGLHNTPDLILHGPGPGTWFGRVCGPGDLNGDGFADLAVGAWFGRGYAPASGTVSIFYGGPRPSSVPALVLKGEVQHGEFGSNLAGLGDVNGDGLPDLAVSAPLADRPESEGGAVYVYFGGKKMDAVADARIPGRGINGGTGSGLAGLGDLDRDGLNDLIIGAPASFGPPTNGGRALIYSFSRFAFTRPRPQEIYVTGDPLLVTWEGAEVANLDYSDDGGKSWTSVARKVGGAPDNRETWTVSAKATNDARLRLTAATPGVSGSVESPPFVVRGR